jgi:hypothetical protein
MSSPIAVSTPHAGTISTLTAPHATDISVSQTAVVNTQATVLSGVQPQTTAPIYISTNRSGSISSTTTNINSSIVPIPVQPIIIPGYQINSMNSSTIKPHSVQPIIFNPV